MKTHKVKILKRDEYNGGIPDGIRTFCGIEEGDCSEDLMENCLVSREDECTCKICERAYQRWLEEDRKRFEQFKKDAEIGEYRC